LNEIKTKYSEKSLKKKNPNEPSYHLAFKYPDTSIFIDICNVILYSAKQSFSNVDKEKIETFLNNFIQIFFNVNIEDNEAKKNKKKV